MDTDPNKEFGTVNSVNINDNKVDPKHSYRMILITIIVLLVALGGFLISQNESLQQILKRTAPTSTPESPDGTQTTQTEVPLVSSVIQDRTIPWMEVVSEQGNQVTAGQTITVYVQAYSGGNDVPGYDVLIGYDRDLLELESLTSALPDYQIFQFDLDTFLSVTGVKDLNKKEIVAFENTNILKMDFVAKKSGAAIISIVPEVGKEQTKLLDDQLKLIFPQVGSLLLEIE